MKTKIMAGIALTAIAATGVVGGFAIANGNLNSAVNAGYASTHSLVFSSTQNKPASSAAYQITDSSMNLHDGGYVWAEFHNGTTVSDSTLNFNTESTVVKASAGTHGSVAANQLMIDVWTNGATSVTCTFSFDSTKVDTSNNKLSVYSDGGYPTAGGTPASSWPLTSGTQVNVDVTGNNHITIQLYVLGKDATNDPVITVTGLTVNFAC